MRIIGGLFSYKLLCSIISFCFLLVIVGSAGPQSVHAVENEITYTGTNTTLIGDDNNAGPFNLGFTFTYYGVNYTQAYININGTVNFGAGSSEYSNGSLNTSGPNNSIYAFWDDLVTDPSPYDQRPIYYATVGSAPNRKFVAQWTNMYFFSTTVQMGTFQVILYEGSNNIQIQYRDLLGGDRALGNSATIGIKKDSSTYEQYSANTASIVQGQSILYSPNGTNDYTVTPSLPTIGQEVSSGYDLVYLAPEGAPTSPTLVNPPNGSTGTTTTPTFEWLPVDGATSYTVLVSTVSNFSSTVVNASGQTGTSYTLGSPLSNGTMYYWRVQSVNSYGSSLSSTRSFTTGTANAAPNTPTSVVSSKLLDGAQSLALSGAELTANLSDPDSGQQVRYRIQMASNNTFTNLMIDYRGPFVDQGSMTYTYGETGGTYLVGSSSTALSPGNYYLRIRTEDIASASSEWYIASGVAFEVIADTVAPNISSISSSSITSNSAIVSWITDELASSRVEYGLVSSYGFQTTESNTSPRVTSHTVTLTSLKPCARYFYRVKSKDQDNNEGVSSNRNFTTIGCATSEVSRGAETSVVSTVGGSLNISTTNTVAAITVPANFASQNASFQINQLEDSLAPTPPTGAVIASENLFNLVAVDTNDNQITTFDEPVTFTVTYNESVENEFVESSLDVYKYDGSDWIKKNCTLNTTANTLTCALAGFSVYGVIGTPKPSTTPTQTQSTAAVAGASTTQDASIPICHDETPSGVPDLFQIDASGTTAILYFTPIANTSHYFISYSKNSNAEDHGVIADLGSDGVQSYTIRELHGGAKYFFKVRGQNGCMPGNWSNIKSMIVGYLAPSKEPLETNTSTAKADSPDKVAADYTDPFDSPAKQEPIPSSKKSEEKVKLDILYILLASLVIFVTFILLFILIKRRKSKKDKTDDRGNLPSQ